MKNKLVRINHKNIIKLNKSWYKEMVKIIQKTLMRSLCKKVESDGRQQKAKTITMKTQGFLKEQKVMTMNHSRKDKTSSNP